MKESLTDVGKRTSFEGSECGKRCITITLSFRWARGEVLFASEPNNARRRIRYTLSSDRDRAKAAYLSSSPKRGTHIREPSMGEEAPPSLLRHLIRTFTFSWVKAGRKPLWHV